MTDPTVYLIAAFKFGYILVIYYSTGAENF